jgi:hypothetical protein
MSISKPSAEETVVKLPQVEVLAEQGVLRKYAVRQISVAEQIDYRWKRNAVD